MTTKEAIEFLKALGDAEGLTGIEIEMKVVLIRDVKIPSAPVFKQRSTKGWTPKARDAAAVRMTDYWARRKEKEYLEKEQEKQEAIYDSRPRSSILEEV